MPIQINPQYMVATAPTASAAATAVASGISFGLDSRGTLQLPSPSTPDPIAPVEHKPEPWH